MFLRGAGPSGTCWVVLAALSSFCPMARTGETPSVDGDAGRVTWAHAVNSRELLRRALDSAEVSFLEADVSAGRLTDGSEPETAVMAHPPAEESDVSLDQWLDAVRDTDKGVKLDFKSDRALELAGEIMKKRKLPATLWLNADILAGPQDHLVPQVSPGVLLDAWSAHPDAVLSPGWTTSLGPPDDRRYSWQDVWLMARTLACSRRADASRITFPVRGIFLRRSVPQLTWLTSVTGRGTSLTVWSSPLDPLDVRDLLLVRRAFPRSQVYYDLPVEQARDFEKIRDSVDHEEEGAEPWAILRRGGEPFGCEDATLLSPGVHVVYGGGRRAAAVLGRPLTYPLEVSARIRPRELSGTEDAQRREGEVLLVLADDPAFWEGDWTRTEGRAAVAFRVADPCTDDASSSAPEWKLSVGSGGGRPVLTRDGGNCSLDVTQFPLELRPGASFLVGLVFGGPSPLVVEGLRVRGTTPDGHTSSAGAPHPALTGALMTTLNILLSRVLR